MTSLDMWEAFVHVHRERSVGAAARALGLSQPAVSARLHRLEEETGQPLFVRSRVGVEPTRAADALARRLTPLVDELRLALKATDPVVTGVLRIGGASDLMTARIVPALAPLIRRGLDLEVSTGLALDLLGSLAEGDLDLVVSSVRPTDPHVVATSFVDEEFLLVAAPSLAGQVDPELLKTDPVGALARVPLVSYASDLPIIRRYWLTEFEQRPVNRVALVLPDLRGLLRAVAAGVGASVLPRYLVDPALGDGTVVLLHEPKLGPLNTLWLATQPAPAGSVVAVCEHLRREASSWPST